MPMMGSTQKLLIVILVAWSFGTLAAPRQLTVGEHQEGTLLRLPIDTVAVIELPANASTGVTWKKR